MSRPGALGRRQWGNNGRRTRAVARRRVGQVGLVWYAVLAPSQAPAPRQVLHLPMPKLLAWLRDEQQAGRGLDTLTLTLSLSLSLTLSLSLSLTFTLTLTLTLTLTPTLTLTLTLALAGGAGPRPCVGGGGGRSGARGGRHGAR